MSKKVRWGIVGTGGIAHQFARALTVIPDAELVAVSSRKMETAKKFAAEFKVPNCHVTAASLANDKDVDVAYIATPHPMHKDETILCLNGGKAVLCEKPFAMNSAEVAEMIRCSKKNKRFLMEAMWTYFFPAVQKIREIIHSGQIGEVRLATVNFCFNKDPLDPDGRLINPVLGGGALLDIGIYDIAYAQMIFGKEPAKITSSAFIGSIGVDEQASMIFEYGNGQTAALNISFRVDVPCEAFVCGTKGWIKVPHMFFHPDRFILKIGQAAEKEYTFERLGNGYAWQAIEVMKCMEQGKLESQIMPLSTSVAFMNTMDKIRKQWNLVYPMEK